MEKIEVAFDFADHKVIKAEKGTLLSEICSQSGYPQDLVCGGKGNCGKCTTDIVINGQLRTVLACCFPVEECITVKRINNLMNNHIKVLAENQEFSYDFNPDLSCLHLSAKELRPGHCGSFTDKLKEKYHLGITNQAMQQLSEVFAYGDDDAFYSLITCNGKVIDAFQRESELPLYGGSVDIGTTTVVCHIYDLTKGKLLGTYFSLNKQTKLGADVLTRINYCVTHKKEKGIDTLRAQIVETINDLLTMAAKDGIDLNNIYRMVLCGNTTMQHLFLGFYPENLGLAPFISITHDFMEITGKEAALKINDRANVTFLPILGGFVGADTTSVLLSLADNNKIRLVFDLGTNGEIACGNKEKYMVTSTACGPALEGAGLSCGMRACTGAIQHFRIEEDHTLFIDTIGDAPATGICGSGVIDIFAELLENGVINRRGKLLSAEQYEAKYGKDNVSRRLCPVKSGEREVNAFVLAFAEESGTDGAVYFSQLDVREIQKAKGAIASGWRILLRMYGIELAAIDEICLAGAFGNYLDTQNAQFIGLLPATDKVPVRSIGNGAGTGVQQFLLNREARNQCLQIKEHVTHQELNLHPDFDKVYLEELQSL